MSWQKAIQGKLGLALKIEDVISPLMQLKSASDNPAAVWQKLAAEWRTVAATRLKHNQAFNVLADFPASLIAGGWVTQGWHPVWLRGGRNPVDCAGRGCGLRPTPSARLPHPRPLPKLPGSLHAAEHLVPQQRVSLKLAGGEFGGHLEYTKTRSRVKKSGSSIAACRNGRRSWTRPSSTASRVSRTSLQLHRSTPISRLEPRGAGAARQ